MTQEEGTIDNHSYKLHFFDGLVHFASIRLDQATSKLLANSRLGVLRLLLKLVVLTTLLIVESAATKAILVDRDPNDKEEGSNGATNKRDEGINNLLLNSAESSATIGQGDDPTEGVKASTSEVVEEHGRNEDGTATNEASPNNFLVEFLGAIAVENSNGDHEGTNALKCASLVVSNLNGAREPRGDTVMRSRKEGKSRDEGSAIQEQEETNNHTRKGTSNLCRPDDQELDNVIEEVDPIKWLVIAKYYYSWIKNHTSLNACHGRSSEQWSPKRKCTRSCTHPWRRKRECG